MRILEPGALTPHLFFLGHQGVCVYLLKGKDGSLLIDSGMTVMWKLLLEQIGSSLPSPSSLTHHFLTHSHYDHIGCTPHLKRWIPTLTVASHPRVGEILLREGAVERIRFLNEEGVGKEFFEENGIPPFTPFSLDRHLQDGERFSFGGVTVEVLYTPGHTQDSISYFVPELKALIPGESAGVPDFSGTVFPEFTYSFMVYWRSLKKIVSLPVEILCLPHNGVVTGEDVEGYFKESLRVTWEFREKILEVYRKEKNLERTVSVLDSIYYNPEKTGQPRSAFLLNLKAMVSAVVREE